MKDEPGLQSDSKCFDLLKYYQTYPYDDVINLNYKGEGCAAIFGKECCHLQTLNRLLLYSIGKLSEGIDEKNKRSEESMKKALDFESHLYNHKTISSHINKNASK